MPLREIRHLDDRALYGAREATKPLADENVAHGADRITATGGRVVVDPIAGPTRALRR